MKSESLVSVRCQPIGKDFPTVESLLKRNEELKSTNSRLLEDMNNLQIMSDQRLDQAQETNKILSSMHEKNMNQLMRDMNQLIEQNESNFYQLRETLENDTQATRERLRHLQQENHALKMHLIEHE